MKWEHIRQALDAWSRGETWALLDARFDVGILLTSEEVLEFKRRWESDADGGR